MEGDSPPIDAKNNRLPHKALHRTAILLRSIAAGELYVVRKDMCSIGVLKIQFQ